MLKCDVLIDQIAKEEDLDRDQVERIIDIICETQIVSYAAYNEIEEDYVIYGDLCDLEADVLSQDLPYDVDVFVQVEFREPLLKVTNIQ